MHSRWIAVALLIPLFAGLGCAKKRRYFGEVLFAANGSRQQPSTREELEALRKKTLANPDQTAILEYAYYLWLFDWEWRPLLEQYQEDPSKAELPEELSGYERATYAEELAAAWQGVRPSELTDETRREALTIDFFVAGLSEGCSGMGSVAGELLVHYSPDKDNSKRDLMVQVLRAECKGVPDYHHQPCRIALDQLADTPHYQPGSYYPTPRDVVMIDCEDMAEDVHGENANAETLWAGWTKPEEVESHELYQVDRQLARQSAMQGPQSVIGSLSPDAGSGSDTGTGTDSGSSHVSFTLFNACPETVKLFFGDDPQFGGGRSSTLGSNTRENHSGTVGDVIWLVDASGKGVSNVSLSAGMGTIEVAKSCTSLMAR
jgi:hypothetical protein